MDRTAEFREQAVAYATNAGDPAKLAKVRSSSVLPPVKSRSEFRIAAASVAKSLQTMRVFVAKHRPIFFHPERASERERDSIEGEVGLFVKACKESIDKLQDKIEEMSKSSRPSKHHIAHLQGAVLILSEKLQSVTESFDECRAVRFKESLASWEHTCSIRQEVASHSEVKPRGPTASGSGSMESQSQPTAQLQQQLMANNEGENLARQLAGLVDQVRETEGRVVEISTLNHLFSTQVVQQAQQIETLYQQALQATLHIERGNHELRKAAHYNKGGRKWFVYVMLVASLLLLFLDWITK